MSNFNKVTLDKVKTGIKIRKAIITSNDTIEEIAYNLGLNTSRVIYEWMKGSKTPSIENLLNLSMMLNLTVEDLVAMS